MRETLAVMKALADEGRLRIVVALEQPVDMCRCDQYEQEQADASDEGTRRHDHGCRNHGSVPCGWATA